MFKKSVRLFLAIIFIAASIVTPVKAAPAAMPSPWCMWTVAKMLMGIAGTWGNGYGTYHVPLNSSNWTQVADVLSINTNRFEGFEGKAWIELGKHISRNFDGVSILFRQDTTVNMLVDAEIEIDVVTAFPDKRYCGPDDPSGWAGTGDYQPARTQGEGTFSLNIRQAPAASVIPPIFIYGMAFCGIIVALAILAGALHLI